MKQTCGGAPGWCGGPGGLGPIIPGGKGGLEPGGPGGGGVLPRETAPTGEGTGEAALGGPAGEAVGAEFGGPGDCAWVCGGGGWRDPGGPGDGPGGPPCCCPGCPGLG